MILIPDDATLEQAKRLVVEAVLVRNGGNKAHAAAQLGISQRGLYYMLEQWHGEEMAEIVEQMR